MRFVDKDEAEEAQYVVCATWDECIAYKPIAEALGGQRTLIQGVCCQCGRLVGFSNRSPKTPARICQYCYAKLPHDDEERITGKENQLLFGLLNVDDKMLKGFMKVLKEIVKEVKK